MATKSFFGRVAPLTDYSKVKVWGKHAADYPPILDKDPEFAAAFLTIEDSRVYYDVMKEAFSYLKENKEGYHALKESITISYSNFVWFSSFLRKLEELLGIEDKFEIPYEFTPEVVKYEKVQFQPPIHKTTNGKHHIVYDRIKIKSKDPIDKHRVNYIKKNLELEEFRDGFPAWYLMQNTIVYENYNEKTNTRVRIDFRNGEFRYFICGASDNWQEVGDIPLEMDHFISALIFRN